MSNLAGPNGRDEETDGCPELRQLPHFHVTPASKTRTSVQYGIIMVGNNSHHHDKSSRNGPEGMEYSLILTNLLEQLITLQMATHYVLLMVDDGAGRLVREVKIYRQVEGPDIAVHPNGREEKVEQVPGEEYGDQASRD